MKKNKILKIVLILLLVMIAVTLIANTIDYDEIIPMYWLLILWTPAIILIMKIPYKASDEFREVAYIVNISDKNPSQWEGRLTDGRIILVHYRYGTFRVFLSKDSQYDNSYVEFLDVVTNIDLVVENDVGEEFQSTMSAETMRTLLTENNFTFKKLNTNGYTGNSIEFYKE